MGAMFGNLNHTAELEAPSVRAGKFTKLRSYSHYMWRNFSETIWGLLRQSILAAPVAKEHRIANRTTTPMANLEAVLAARLL